MGDVSGFWTDVDCDKRCGQQRLHQLIPINHKGSATDMDQSLTDVEDWTDIQPKVLQSGLNISVCRGWTILQQNMTRPASIEWPCWPVLVVQLPLT